MENFEKYFRKLLHDSENLPTFVASFGITSRSIGHR